MYCYVFNCMLCIACQIQSIFYLFYPQTNTKLSDGEAFSYTLKQPLGVCGLILPWNVPIIAFATKVTTALAAGEFFLKIIIVIYFLP